jgi:hypothetical protein
LRKVFLRAWKTLISAYLTSLGLSGMVGWLLIHIINIEPKTLFEISTKRISYTLPLLEAGFEKGIDRSIMLFIWNTLTSLAILSFIYTASWFDPDHSDQFPHLLRKRFCSKNKMKLLCYLPGCSKIEAEPLRRVYLWLMVPFYGIILLGVENGLSISTAPAILGSYGKGLIALLPHGIIEIPTICFAGATVYAAYLHIKANLQADLVDETFNALAKYRQTLPLQKIAVGVIVALLIAGIVEAHVTLKIMAILLAQT